MKKQKKLLTQLGKIFLLLLIIFSQVNAPIVALAEELEENATKEETVLEKEKLEEEKPEEEAITTEETSKAQKEEPTPATYTVTINSEKVTEYTVQEDNKVVTINQEYDAEEGTYKFSNNTTTIDFSKKLYGTYTYTYSVLTNEEEVLDTKELSFVYEGNNVDILEQYANDVKIRKGSIAMNGKSTLLTAGEVLEKFRVEDFQNDYDAKIIVRNQSGNTLESSDYIDENSKLILASNEIEEEFSIYIIGDYTGDMILNIEDSKTIIDYMLSGEQDDENGNPIYSIYEATNAMYLTDSIDNIPEKSDELTNALENEKEVYKGEELEVKYYIKGFDKDKLNGIYGVINFDKNILELSEVQITNPYEIYGKVDTEKNIGRFAYILDNYNSEDVLMTIKFKTLAAGTTNISIDNIGASYLGEIEMNDESVSTSVEVIEAGKGGDTEPKEETTTETTTTTAPTQPVSTTPTTSYLRPISLSSDSLIKSLEIKGYEIDFDKNKFEYSIKVKNSVTSLDLTIVLSDPSASYNVIGNENFKVGENTVEIKVTAEDRSTSTYTIKVEREKASKTKKKAEVEEENSGASKAIIIALIVLVIIGLIYVIFKDDEDDKK